MIKYLYLIILFLLSGCGYQFQGSGSALPKEIKKIYISPIENNTTESNLTLLLQESVTDEFERYGVLEIVDNFSDADAVLNLQIIDIKRDQRSSTSATDVSLQLDTILTLSAEINSVVTGSRIWSAPSLSVTDVFGTQAGAVVTSSVDFASSGMSASNLLGLNSRELARGQEGDAFQRLAEKSAKKIYLEAVMPEF